MGDPGTGTQARRRTFGIVAHVDAGKTTLTEQLLFAAGVRRFAGAVDDGTAAMDWLREEQERGISIAAASARLPWDGHELQLVDTPGHVDFSAEVECALAVVDGVVVLLDGTRGVESQTIAAWRRADRRELPRLVFVNKLDRAGADLAMSLRSLRERLECHPLPLIVPFVARDGGLVGLAHVLGGRVRWASGAPDAGDRDRIASAVRAARHQLVEALAEIDDAILAAFVDDRDPGDDALAAAVHAASLSRRGVPVLAGSALGQQGVEWLLDAIVAWLPAFEQGRRLAAATGAPRDTEASQALVFKIHHDDEEAVAHLRLFAGRLAAGDVLAIARAGSGVGEFRVPALWRVLADRHEVVGNVEAGEIVAVPGAAGLCTGDVLHAPGQAPALQGPELPAPVLAATLEPASAVAPEAMAAAAAALAADDPSLRFASDPETGLLAVHGLGELQIEIAGERLSRRLGVPIRLSRPRVAHRESIARAASGEAAVRLDLPSGHADASAALVMTPLPVGSANEVELATDVDAASDPRRFVLARLQGGLRAPVPCVAVSVRVERLVAIGSAALVVEASHRALEVALEKAFADADPHLLAPQCQFAVRCPDDCRSFVLADLNARGATIQSVRSGVLGAVVEGDGPLRAFLGYPTRLRSLTKGQGEVQLAPAGFARVADEDSSHRA